jgi:hypothetical protein
MCGAALVLVGCGGGSGSNGERDGGSNPLDGATAATHVVINFDDIATCAPVTTQYADHASFSGPGGAILATSNVGIGITSNYLGPLDGNDAGCSGVYLHDFHIVFAHKVNALQFVAVGVCDSPAAEMSITHGAGQTDMVSLFGTVTQARTLAADLSSFSDVTEVDLAVTDPAGIGLDDFSFDE